jgi:hypothetical protein
MTEASRKSCRVPFVPADDAFDRLSTDAKWAGAAVLHIEQFHANSSAHRPRTIVHIQHHRRAIGLRYEVSDRHVICRHTENQQSVCEDSCVEFFVQARPGAGYFNFEFNCGGTIHCHYIEDWRRTPTGFVRHRPLSNTDLAHVSVRSSLPRTVWPESPEPVAWKLEVLIRLEAIEPYVGEIGSLSGQTFAANFYKCADRSSHPHWGSWSAIGEALNFHQPSTFGLLQFE